MKKILTALVLMTFVWGCAKKIAPADSATSSANSQTMPADTNIGKGTDGTDAAATVPVANTGTFGTKEAAKERTGDATAEVAGQTVYNAKCGGCHGIKVASDYTAERWASILAVMAPRARLSDTEKENVYAYVKANAKK